MHYLRVRIPLGGYPDPLPVWRRVARAGLQVMRVPGGHLDLTGAQAQRAAALIDAMLASPAPAPADMDGEAGGLLPVRAGVPLAPRRRSG